MALRTVGVKLVADISNYTANMKKAGESTKSFSEGLGKKAAAGKLDAIADRAGMVGLAVGAGFGLAVKAAADFDKQMSAVKAATHASAAEMDKMRQAALKAGKDTQFSATEAAKGIEELSKAGVSTADILGGGLKGALDLAAAGELDVGVAAETAASALTQFKLRGQDVPHVADLLAAAAGKAQGSVQDMSSALNQAGLIAAGTGLTIEDTTGTLAAFASAGLIGSDAGTSFKTMLQSLQAPSGKTLDLMDDLGISAYNASGQFIGITALAGQLKDKLSKLTPELRANAFAQIFGSDATRAANILYEQGADGIQKWIEKTNDAGYAAETAAIKTDNLAGDLERLKGSLETLMIESGGGAQTGLRAITKSLEAMVDQFARLPSGIGATVVAMAGLTAAVLLGGAAWVKVRSTIASTVVELNAVGPAGARAARGLQSSAKAAGIAGVAFAAMEVGAAVFDKLGNAPVNVDKLAASMENYAQTGKMSEGITKEFGNNLEEMSLIAESAKASTSGFWGTLNDLTSFLPITRAAIDSVNEVLTGTSFNDARDRMQSLDEAFVKFTATQKDAKKAGELWNQILAQSGLDTDELVKLLPNAYAALGELQKTAHGAAGAQGQLAASTGKTAEELKKEEEAAKELSKAFDDLFNRYMSADQAAAEYEKQLVDTNKELETGKKKLDLQSEAGQKNRAATLDLIKAVKEQREANINNGMSVDRADEKYRNQIQTLGATMVKLKFTAKDVEKLIGKYRDIPNKVDTKLTVTGDKAVMNKLLTLSAYQKALKQGSSNVADIRKNLSKDNADFLKFHDGGRTPNVGEHEPVGVVHGKETVLSAKTTRAIDRQAPGFIDEMLATQQLPGYRAGGRVGWPFPVSAAGTKVPSAAEVAAVVGPAFSKDWPSSPSAQRGDSGVWRDVVRLIKSGPKMGSFGNAYRPGDPLWHGSGRAVDWMGFNMDPLAQYLASKGPLELIHRTKTRDYAYTRGRNKGSFNESLMNAHRNHIHIAMENGGTIQEPVYGVGASGRTYSFGEGYKPERVTPNWQSSGSGGGGGGNTYVLNATFAGPVGSQYELDNWLAAGFDRLKRKARV